MPYDWGLAGLIAPRVVTGGHGVCSLFKLVREDQSARLTLELAVSDEKARDILGELEARATLGAHLTSAVGRRGWTRPRVSISPRLFIQYRLGDPWDPGSKDTGTQIGLGPVSLRLGEKRQPAPHLKPKEPKKPQTSVPTAPPQPRVPKAQAPKPKPKPAPALSPEALETARLAAAAAEKRRKAEAAGGGPRRRSKATRSTPVSRSSGPALAPMPVRPEARAATEAPRPEPAAASAQEEKGGRFRMKPAARSSAPVVRELQPSEPAEAAETEPGKPSPTRAAPGGPVRGGLDDLFAAAAQAGRMRVPKRSKDSAEE
jgi:hypothetical protein